MSVRGLNHAVLFVLVPDDLVEREVVAGVPPIRPLDLDAEIARYGADVPGGPRTDHHLQAMLMALLAHS